MIFSRASRGQAPSAAAPAGPLLVPRKSSVGKAGRRGSSLSGFFLSRAYPGPVFGKGLSAKSLKRGQNGQRGRRRCCNSYNCGVLGYHTERLAGAGLLGLGFTNAPASIAASGGRKPALGTNPWSIAVPDGKGGASIVIDQSASVVAKSEVAKRAREGKPIPLGWALGPEGEPTTDPNIGLKGTMLPAGGYKGVGSALLVELMAACLAGATIGARASPFSGTAGGPPKTGQCFIAIAPDAASGGEFKARISQLLEALTEESSAHVPGKGRREARANAERQGVAVDPKILEKVSALAGAQEAR